VAAVVDHARDSCREVADPAPRVEAYPPATSPGGGAVSVANVTFTVAVGFGNAGSVRVGWAIGARDHAGARRAGLAAFGAGGAFMSLAALVFFLFPGAIAPGDDRRSAS
jgi:hypothetical protein